jgi:hypothetical protein
MYFDITMPAALFAVVIVAMFLDNKIEHKLKNTIEKREFRSRDIFLLVAMITVTVSVIVFIPQLAIMAVFLFAYSTLLFTFSYVFSNIQRVRAQLFIIGFMIASLLAGTVGIFNIFSDALPVYGAIAFFSFAVLMFAALIYEQKRTETKERWYLAVIPPILFVLLYIFFNGTPVWFPYLLDLYGLVFAVLIILYIGTVFTWKTALIFAGVLTVLDIILVLGTGTMISAAKHVSGLGLPVLVSLPTIPLIMGKQGILYISLGLGDFFFAGILATQTLKKFGRKTALIALVTMCISFGLFEAYLLNSTSFVGFPGTLMIICGWLPIIGLKIFADRKHQKPINSS